MGNSESIGLAATAIKVAGVAGVAVGAAAVAFSIWSSSVANSVDADLPSRQQKTPVADADANVDFQHIELQMLRDLRPRIPREPQQQRVIKIMSYNLWSIEDMKTAERMKAISQIIQHHSPHIILFQEVTPVIYKIFETCDWWRTYSCSVSPKKATRKLFCMQLSKLQVKKFFRKKFKSTTTGRGLDVARITTRTNKELTVATCHLKRPTLTDMYCTERVDNAKEAIEFLDIGTNVVFGGDMNWNEDSDGFFPLLPTWHDAWSFLRPNESGFTFNTLINGMLGHRRLLQRRLDRFLCKLKDFEMVSIDMIGMEAIPGISYRHNGQMLPVLPSDHYGLMLAIRPK